MAADSNANRGMRNDLSRASRRFNAWWEGYAYDSDDAPAQSAAPLPADGRDVEPAIAGLIWGPGRTEPGDPAWTMRHARTLGLSTRARMIVFGAGAGAPLKDLKSGARWRATGFSRHQAPASGVRLRTYDAAMTRLNTADWEGALCFFELHRDPDPAGFARVAAELVRPGAPVAFVDFATARKAVRLRSCFPDVSPRLSQDYARALKEAGFSVSDTIDETRTFTPLIARGWAHWRRAYEWARAIKETPGRAEALRFLAEYAHLWAERLDALRSGQLQVVRMQARKAPRSSPEADPVVEPRDEDIKYCEHDEDEERELDLRFGGVLFVL